MKQADQERRFQEYILRNSRPQDSLLCIILRKPLEILPLQNERVNQERQNRPLHPGNIRSTMKGVEKKKSQEARFGVYNTTL